MTFTNAEFQIFPDENKHYSLVMLPKPMTAILCDPPGVVSRGAVRSAASSYAAVRMVAGSRPILVIAWEWHIDLVLLCGCSGALEYPTTNSCGPINKSLSLGTRHCLLDRGKAAGDVCQMRLHMTGCQKWTPDRMILNVLSMFSPYSQWRNEIAPFSSISAQSINTAYGIMEMLSTIRHFSPPVCNVYKLAHWKCWQKPYSMQGQTNNAEEIPERLHPSYPSFSSICLYCKSDNRIIVRLIRSDLASLQHEICMYAVEGNTIMSISVRLPPSEQSEFINIVCWIMVILGSHEILSAGDA